MKLNESIFKLVPGLKKSRQSMNEMLRGLERIELESLESSGIVVTVGEKKVLLQEMGGSLYFFFLN